MLMKYTKIISITLYFIIIYIYDIMKSLSKEKKRVKLVMEANISNVTLTTLNWLYIYVSLIFVQTSRNQHLTQ